MNTKNLIHICLSILIILPQFVYSQDCPTRKNFRKKNNNISELSIGFGGTHYFGDLNTYNSSDRKVLGELHKENMKPAFTLNYRWYFNRFINPRINFMYTRLAGSDRKNVADEGHSASWFRNYRNLTFRTDLLELSLIAEINLLGFQPGVQRRLSPFVMAGVGLIYFSPKAPYNREWMSMQSEEAVSPVTNSSDYQYDRWVKLQPLGTEGQGLPGHPDKYSLIQPNYTIGLGLKCNLSRSVTLAWEVSHHFTFTDYLDDVSTVYPDPKEFYSYYEPDKAQMAANLSVRSKEMDPNGEFSFITGQGQQRGSPKYKDSYLVSLITVGYKISNTDRHSTKSPEKIQKKEDKKNEKQEKLENEYYKDKYYNKKSPDKDGISKK